MQGGGKRYLGKSPPLVLPFTPISSYSDKQSKESPLGKVQLQNAASFPDMIPAKSVNDQTLQARASGARSNIDHRRLESALAQEILLRESAEARVKGLQAILEAQPGGKVPTPEDIGIHYIQAAEKSQGSINLSSIISDRSRQKDFEEEYSRRETAIGVKILEQDNARLAEQVAALQAESEHWHNQATELRQANEEANRNLSLAISTLEELRETGELRAQHEDALQALRGQMEALNDELEAQRHKTTVIFGLPPDAHWRVQNTS